MFKGLGIKTLGEMLVILKLVKDPIAPSPLLAYYAKIATAKIPQILLEMITQQFQKFKIDWDRFTQISLIQSNIQLCSYADETV